MSRIVGAVREPPFFHLCMLKIMDGSSWIRTMRTEEEISDARFRSNAPLVLLPGIGADERMFEPQRRAFPNLIVPKWIEARPEESLREYAERLAATINIARPFYLGGASFGGMVALEMASALKPSGVFLISSARTNKSIPLLLKAFERASRPIPSGIIKRFGGSLTVLASIFGLKTPEHKRLLRDMFAAADVEFIRWGVSALMSWDSDGCEAIPIYHIHGSRDKIIPLRLVKPNHVVRGARHLPSLTHPEEVNRFILDNMK